jgi:type IV secretory pathway TrbL component
MKTTLLSLLVSLSLAASGAGAESAAQKVEQDVSGAAKKTESTVKKAAKKTGDAVETAAKDTGDATKKAANKVAKGTKKVGEDITNSALYQKIEKELGKPFTPEQQAKYAEAWKSAQEKARAAEKEFADKISEITGLGKKKSKQAVSDHGL